MLDLLRRVYIGTVDGVWQREDIREWMHNNLLVLNDRKTEVIHFVSKFKNFERIREVKIGDSFIIPSTSVRNLEVMFDEAGLMT